MSALGSLVVKLALEHAEFTKGLDKSSQEALRFAKNSERAVNDAIGSFKSAAVSVAGLAATFVGVTSAVGAFNRSINQLAALDDLTQKTGAAVDTLSRMQQVAVQFGVDFNTVDAAIVKLSRGIGGLDGDTGKTNEALKALGLSSRDLAGNLRDPADLMIEVAKRLQDYEDSAAKAALVTDLFGKSGADLLPYLNDLATNVDRFSGVSADAAAQAAAFQDNLGALKVNFDQLVQSVVADTLPAINDLFGAFNDVGRASTNLSNDKSVINWADNIALAFAPLVDIISNIKDEIYAIGLSFKVVGADLSVFAARVKILNPAAYYNGNPFEDLRKAEQNRNQTLEKANAVYDKLFNKNRSQYEDALNARINARGTGAQSSFNAVRERLNYTSDEKNKEKNTTKKALEDAAKLERDLAMQESAFRANLMNDEMDAYKRRFEERQKEAKKLADQAEKEEKERIERLMDFQQREATKNFDDAQRASQQAAEQAQRQYEQMAREVSQAFTIGLFQSFQNGEKFGRAMVRNIVALAQTWFARLFENFITNGGAIFSRLASGVGAVFSGQATAGDVLTGRGENSIFGQLSSIRDIFSGGNNFITGSIEKLGTFFANGMGGFGDTIGGFLGKNAASIADGFGYLGSITQALSGNIAGAALTAIGTYFGGPIGGAIGGAIGSLFGGGRPSTKRFSTGVSGEFANGQFTSRNLSGIAGYRRALGGGDALTEVAKQYSQVVNQLFSAFGEAGSIITNASLFQRSSSKTRAWGYFSAQGGGGSVGISQAAPFASAQAALEDLINRIFTDGITGLVATSNLSAGIKKFFEGLADKDAILDAVVTLTSLNAQLKDLPPVFNALRNALDTTAYTTSIADLKQRFANVQTFTSLFYTEQENFATFTKQITSQFGALNQALPTTRDQYRALVDSINVVDEATSDKFHGLVALAPAMDAYFKRLEQQAEGINQVNEALAQGLDRNLFSTYADFVTAQANAHYGLSYTGSIGDLSVKRAQGDAELVSAVKSLVAQQARTDQILQEIASATRKTAEVQERWNGDGLPETRVI